MTDKSLIVEIRRLKCRVIQEALISLGFTIKTENTPGAKILWFDGIMTADESNDARYHHLVNKIPQMDIICYKSTLFQALNQAQSLFPQYYTFFPETYLLPHQFIDFQRCHHKTIGSVKGDSSTWIFKPRSGCCGNGIRIIQSPSVLANETAPGVIQRYISPFLIDGFKFDMRIYLLISSLSPLTLYIYKEGLARFCTTKYEQPTKKNLGNKFAHITNTAVNIENTSATNDFTRLLSDVMKTIEEDPKGEGAWEKIKNVAVLTILSLYPQMISAVSTKSRGAPSSATNKKGSRRTSGVGKYFHVCGIDVLLDENANPIVLELNDRPSMKVQFDCEKNMKYNLIRDTVKIVGAEHCANLEKFKDEENGWEKIFPAPESSSLGPAYRSIQQRVINVLGPKNSILSHCSQKAIIYPKPTVDKNKLFRQYRYTHQ